MDLPLGFRDRDALRARLTHAWHFERRFFGSPTIHQKHLAERLHRLRSRLTSELRDGFISFKGAFAQKSNLDEFVSRKRALELVEQGLSYPSFPNLQNRVERMPERTQVPSGLAG
jgi:hypothetical protein